MNDKPLILRNISRIYGSVTAIAEITLEVHRHEFIAIVGPSGCGKSTLLNILSGSDKPTSGSLSREGDVRMIYQEGGLFPWLTVSENIAMGLRQNPNSSERAAQLEDLIRFIQLEDFTDQYPHKLSGGMRQRVELARALAGRVDLLLMDEPFSALDYLTRLRMRQELVRMLKERPRTVIFVTHDIEEAVQLADRVIVLTERPARIRCELKVTLPRPRSLTHPEVVSAVHHIVSEMGLEETLLEPEALEHNQIV